MTSKHHTEDYKLTAVLHYLENKNTTNLREVCDIFKCKYQSLFRWVRQYENTPHL